jgi:prophage regulatory protein
MSSDRFVGKKELRFLALYSDAHIARLEAAGRFPKRVRLGNGPRCRVGWLLSEISAWMRSKTDGRDVHTPKVGREDDEPSEPP